MSSRESHELAADLLVELAEALEIDAAQRFKAGAYLNEASQIRAGCEAPDWALELADCRLEFARLAA